MNSVRLFGVEVDVVMETKNDVIDFEDFLIPDLALGCGSSMAGIIWPGSFPLLFYIEYCEKTLKSAQTLPAIDSIATTSTTVPMAVSKLPWQENATPDHSLLSNRFFLQNNATLANFEGANVLELGAGTGVCGLTLRRFTKASHVTLTDVDQAMPLLELNKAHMLGCDNVALLNSVSIVPLFWGRENVLASSLRNAPIDVLIASDIVYETKWHAHLIETLVHFSEVNPRMVILLSHKDRYSHESALFEALFAHGFVKRDLLLECPDIITKATRDRYDIDEHFHLFQVWRPVVVV